MSTCVCIDPNVPVQARHPPKQFLFMGHYSFSCHYVNVHELYAIQGYMISKGTFNKHFKEIKNESYVDQIP